MTSMSLDARTLAMELRGSRFGYAVFVGQKLLDWGVSSYQPKSTTGIALAENRIALLLTVFSPSVIAIRGAADQDRLGRSNAVLHHLKGEAHTRRIFLAFMSSEVIKAALSLSPKATKYDVAFALIECFPELIGKVPITRRAWQPEARRMILFDAIATGFAYVELHGGGASPPD